MKYIKLFESHNDYYIKIGLQEFEQTIFDQWLDIKGSDDVLEFDGKEIEYLKRICKSHNGEFSTRHRQSLSYCELSFGQNDIVQIKIIDESDTIDRDCPINIYKIVDEWYVVEAMGGGPDNGIWYKCDQLDGVKKLIEKILNDRKNEIS